jgi:Tfp pilus assembly protein PilF
MMTAPGLKSQSSGSKQTEIQAHLQKAQQALRTSDFAAAESEFRAIVALDPNNLDARGNVGVMLYFQSQWAAAAEQFRKVLEGQPKNWKVEAFLGMCEERQGHPEEARKLLAGALPYLPAGAFQTQAGLELAQVLYRTGDLDGAVDVVRIRPILTIPTCSIPRLAFTPTSPTARATLCCWPRRIQAARTSLWRRC